MPSTFGLCGDSLDHLVHLLLALARLGLFSEQETWRWLNLRAF
jgi:hypothetical protein